MLSGITTYSGKVDSAFWFIFGVDVLLLVGITAVMLYFVVRYHRSRNPHPTNIEGSTVLEILWTVIPTIIVMIMFYVGWEGYKTDRTVPKGALLVESHAKKWAFDFKYPNGKVSKELIVPVGTPVKVVLISQDVVHAFFVPAFRIKRDYMPGRENFVWFNAQKEGVFPLYCAEYCGLQHSKMITNVRVVPAKEYAAWLDKPVEQSPGEMVFQQNCASCHSIDGSKLVGPSLKGIYTGNVTLANGKTIPRDSAYVVRAIQDPNADVVKDFPPNMMPSFKTMLQEQQLKDLLDYLKSLQ